MIGLDTGHLVYNYGTKLQAYAMQKLLSQNGDKVEIIQWHRRDFKVLNGLFGIARKINKTVHNYGCKYWLDIYRRYSAIDRFDKKYNIHKFYGTYQDMQSNMNIYDCVFCGSDQAWLPGNIVKHWYTLEYCGDRIFKAAYAPSFGIEHIEREFVPQYRSYLSRFDALSVRELSGQTIIQDLIGKKIPVVLDPTLLLDRKEWDVLKSEHTLTLPFDESYIFCYFLGSNMEHRNIVKKFGEDLHIKIVNLAHFSGFCEADVGFSSLDLYDVSPQDFIFLIANAMYVCTDSFHCTAFSIQYHKNFTVFQRFNNQDQVSTNSRLYSLLGQLGLEDRIISDKSNIELKDVDYTRVEKSLLLLRENSMKYLKETLKGKRNV